MRLEGLSKSKGDPKGSVQFCQTLERVGGKIVEFKKDWSFYEVHNPKQLFAKLKQLKQI